MLKVDRCKPLEDTLLLKVTQATPEPAVLAKYVPELLVPRNRERGARAGTFDVDAGVDVPSDYRRFAAQYSVAPRA